jgi:uncharacterized protein Usg
MSTEFEEQIRGKRLTTAEVIYYMPDHPSLLQRFQWQTLDIAPDFPRIREFLDYWRREIDAVIHSVNVCSVDQVRPARVRIAGVISRLH